MVLLADQANDWMLDYGVGIVPAVVPWLSACLSVAVVAVGLGERRASSAAGSLLMGALVVVTAWSVAMFPFDALRVVRLVPLPYPVLRTGWALGGTFGTTGDPLDLDPVLAWGAAIAGVALWPSPSCCSSAGGRCGFARCSVSVASCWGWR